MPKRKLRFLHILLNSKGISRSMALLLSENVHAAQLIREECYGKAVAQVGGVITHNDLKDVAGKTKLVPPDHQLVRYARDIGISFGDEKTEKKK